MSHVAEVQAEIRDLDALRVGAVACGGEFMEGQRTHAWWGTFVGDSTGMATRFRDPSTFGKCAHVIRVAGQPGVMGPGGPWEIGVVPNADGTYSLVYDNYGGAGRALEERFGKGLLTLVDEYNAEITLRTMLREGYRIERTHDASGQIVMMATR